MLNHKNIIAIIISAFCLVSLVRAGEYQPKYECSEEEAALYRMPIKQITPKDGIKTGHVIAYGHYIKPPYKFEIREDTLLFVNNVQIYPSLPSKAGVARQTQLREKYRNAENLSKPYMDRFEYLLRIAKNVYKEIALNKNRNTAIDSLYSIFKNDTLLKKILVDITIEPTGKNDATMGITLRYPGYYDTPGSIPSQCIVPFYLYPPEPMVPKFKTKKEEIAYTKKSLEQWVDEYERGLSNGEILVVSSFRGMPHTSRLAQKIPKIVEILRSSQTFEEKCLKLKQLRVIDEKEILYNYNPNEWSILKKLEH